MKESKFKVEDRVEVYLSPNNWKEGGWFKGTIISIEAYTKRRSFHWVRLDRSATLKNGSSMNLISIINLKNIRLASGRS